MASRFIRLLPTAVLLVLISFTIATAADTNARYQIVFSPHVRADTYLLDTSTGMVWQLTQSTNLNDDPLAWRPMWRIDTDAQNEAFIRNFGLKPKPVLKASAPNAKAPQ